MAFSIGKPKLGWWQLSRSRDASSQHTSSVDNRNDACYVCGCKIITCKSWRSRRLDCSIRCVNYIRHATTSRSTIDKCADVKVTENQEYGCCAHQNIQMTQFDQQGTLYIFNLNDCDIESLRKKIHLKYTMIERLGFNDISIRWIYNHRLYHFYEI